MRNKFFIIGSIALGVIILASVVGSLLLSKRPAIITQNVPQKMKTDTTASPAMVTVDALSPEEIVRLVLQMWYTRDWSGMYTLLDASLQRQESHEAFVARMEKLPALRNIAIRDIRRADEKEKNVILALQIDAKTDKGQIKRDVSFAFQKIDERWRVMMLPDFDASSER